MQFFEYLFGILSEILMCEIILLELLGNVGVCDIHLHHGYMKKKKICEKCMKWKKIK